MPTLYIISLVSRSESGDRTCCVADLGTTFAAWRCWWIARKCDANRTASITRHDGRTITSRRQPHDGKFDARFAYYRSPCATCVVRQSLWRH